MADMKQSLLINYRAGLPGDIRVTEAAWRVWSDAQQTLRQLPSNHAASPQRKHRAEWDLLQLHSFLSLLLCTETLKHLKNMICIHSTGWRLKSSLKQLESFESSDRTSNCELITESLLFSQLHTLNCCSHLTTSQSLVPVCYCWSHWDYWCGVKGQV